MLTFDEKNELIAAACHQFVHREVRSYEYLNQSRCVQSRCSLFKNYIIVDMVSSTTLRSSIEEYIIGLENN